MSETQPDSNLDLAVIVHQPQLTPADTLACWSHFSRALDRQDVGIDPVVASSKDAEPLSDSRSHAFGDVAREGRVLYVAQDVLQTLSAAAA